MKKAVVLIPLMAFVLGGCAGSATMNDVPGALFAQYKSARDAEGSVKGKTGEACAESILGWIATGDASVEKAAANGGITSVTSVDRKVKNVLGLYAQYCTVVKGK
ncbi:MAG: TRL-like family protein [Deltaproteobacteria bacterium]|jgi:hypothetical protein